MAFQELNLALDAPVCHLNLPYGNDTVMHILIRTKLMIAFLAEVQTTCNLSARAFTAAVEPLPGSGLVCAVIGTCHSVTQRFPEVFRVIETCRHMWHVRPCIES